MNDQSSLSGLDAVFLSLETPCTPMHMIGTFVIDASRASGGCSFERILRLLAERMPELAPFRRRLAAIPFGFDHPVWIDDPDFHLPSHVHRIAAPAPGSDEVLADLVAQVAAHPLDRTRPLWELWVIEGLSDERMALVFKIHHAVADGVSTIRLLLQLLDSGPEMQPAFAGPEMQPASAGPEMQTACALPVPIRENAAPTSRVLLSHALSRLPRRSLRFARLLRDTAVTAAGMARTRVVGVGGRQPSMPMPFSAPRMAWNGATSPQRTVAYGAARLSDVKRVNAAFATSVNHVVLAACTRSLRRYLEAHGGAPTVPLVAAVPVSSRVAADAQTYGNRISAFLVHLPVHLADPLAQLIAVRDDAAASSRLHAELGASALGEWAEFMSAALLAGAARFYSKQQLATRHTPLHNLVISNVRGPSTPLYAAGARLTAAYPLGPLMEGAGMNITVVSYVDSVGFGIIACARSVPDVAEIARGFGRAVEELAAIADDTSAARRAATLPRALQRHAADR